MDNGLRIVAIIGFILCHAPSHAQSTSGSNSDAVERSAAPTAKCSANSVCGFLLDADQAPIPFAQIEIEFEDQIAISTSGEDGFFEAPRESTPQQIRILVDGSEVAVVPFERFIADSGRILLDQYAGAAQSVIVVEARVLSQPFARRTVSQLEVLTNPIANADALLAVAGLASATNLDNSADVQLRGSAAGLSRVYYNDIPLYEVVRGSTVDRVTRVSSILSSSILRDVETYASVPPAYLANSAAGAIRVIPGVDENAPDSVFLGLPGASGSAAFDLSGGAGQIYANAIDLSGTLALNPGLDAVTERFRSVGLGSAARLDLDSGAEINTLSVFDYEDAAYPLAISNLSGLSQNERARVFSVIGAEIPFADQRLKIDSAFTATRNDLAYLGQTVSANNVYLYVNTDLAGNLPGDLGGFRVGVTSESFILDAAGTLLFEAGVPDFRQVEEVADYANAFAFVTLDPLDNLKLALGTRQTLSSNPDLPASYSLTATLSSIDRRHRLIAGIGRFAAILPPEIVTIDPVVTAQSEQVSLDYEFTVPALEIRLGGYLKRDRIDAIVTDIHGFDASFNWQAAAWLNLSGAAAHSRQTSNGARGDLDLDYIVRLQARMALTDTLTFNASLTAKSGARFTPVIDRFEFAPGAFAPIFDNIANRDQLDDFRTFDINLIKRLDIGLSGMGPFAFVGITNLFDRRNESRAIYASDFSSASRIFFERRAISFGLTHSF